MAQVPRIVMFKSICQLIIRFGLNTAHPLLPGAMMLLPKLSNGLTTVFSNTLEEPSDPLEVCWSASFLENRILIVLSENLAAGTGSGYGIAQAIDSWSSEVCMYPFYLLYFVSLMIYIFLAQYDPSNPVASHFTQMVWKATTQVGCAVASCSGIFAASFGVSRSLHSPDIAYVL